MISSQSFVATGEFKLEPPRMIATQSHKLDCGKRLLGEFEIQSNVCHLQAQPEPHIL